MIDKIIEGSARNTFLILLMVVFVAAWGSGPSPTPPWTRFPTFLPVFTLEAQEGRLFRPLAFTKSFAMAFSAILSITGCGSSLSFCSCISISDR